jgi:flagellar hook-associated protein 2
MLSIDGLVTGLDTTTIIDGLLSIQQNRVSLLTIQQQKVIESQSAFKGVEANLLTLDAQISQLTKIKSSVFEAKSANSSDVALVNAAATEDAAVGTYNLRVNNLAAAHQIATQGFADEDSAITEGTLQIQVGSAPPVSITVDSSNNTVSALVEAINDSGAEVSAVIINDQSTPSTPHRILLSAEETGADNAIVITNNLATSGGGAEKPVFDMGNPVQEAIDASITLGSGTGAISTVHQSNTVTDLIPGVTLSLIGADAAKDVTISVTSDTSSAKNAVADFVDSFNGLMQFIDDQVRFDAETEAAGTLLGNRSVISIQDDIRRAVTDVVPGLATQMNRLSALGITIDSNGQLVLDSNRLDEAFAGSIEGVSNSDIRRLFSLDGQSDNGNIRFVLGSTKTKETTTGYQVDVTQVAERAAITAANALAASTVIDSSNNNFTITVDGQLSSTLTLSDGTYTRAELAAHLEDVISADPELASRSVSITLASNNLQITSELFGSTSETTIGSGTALTALGFSGSETDTGQDVAGKFIVDGFDETAVGNGQLLSGDSDNENTAGLQIQVTLTSSQLQSGAEATLTVTRGIAARMEGVLDTILDPVTGRIKTLNDGFDDTVDSIQEAIDRINDQFEAQRDRLVREFAALESTVNQLQTTSSFLTTQLLALSNLSAGSLGR